jgi:hypothetical protein
MGIGEPSGFHPSCNFVSFVVHEISLELAFPSGASPASVPEEKARVASFLAISEDAETYDLSQPRMRGHQRLTFRQYSS